MGAIDGQRFVIARLGRLEPSFILVDIADMADGMSELQRFAGAAIDRRSLFIMLERCARIFEVALNLAKTGERTGQSLPFFCLAAGADSFNQIASGIGRPMVSSRLGSLVQEVVDCVCHNH